MFAQDLNIIPVQQGSKEWHEYRKTRIGASDAPCIMGVGFNTPLERWKQKLDLMEVVVTHHMQRGSDLEPYARKDFIQFLGKEVYPAVVQSKEYPWMFASLDGISYDGKLVVEIKCPGYIDHGYAIQRSIPAKYFPQCQHIMLVLNVNEMYYFSFFKGSGELVKVYADKEYQRDLLKKEQDFYKRLITFEQPELTDRDYIHKTDHDFLYHVHEYRKLLTQEKQIEQLKESHRNAIIHLADKQNVEGGGIRVHQTTRKGLVDYNAIPELIGVDLEKYRRPNIESVRITEVNDG